MLVGRRAFESRLGYRRIVKRERRRDAVRAIAGEGKGKGERVERGGVEREVEAFFGVALRAAQRLMQKPATLTTMPERQFRNVAWGRSHTTALVMLAHDALGVPVRFGVTAPGTKGVAAYYNPIPPRYIWVDALRGELDRFYLLAHEAAHAISHPDIVGSAGSGPWFLRERTSETYGMGEIVAETSAFLATRPYVLLTNAIAPLYVASYATWGRSPERALADAFPHAVRATETLRKALESTRR